MKRLLRAEDDLIEWLIDRSWKKGGAENEAGWEGWLLSHWPKYLTLNYWGWLFGNQDVPWLNLPSPITDTYEWREWLWSGRWRWTYLTEETMAERVVCRWRGHPEGVIWFSSGYEPDTRCKTCGEEIG